MDLLNLGLLGFADADRRKRQPVMISERPDFNK